MAAQSSIAQELVYNSKPGAAPAAVLRVNTPPFNKDNFNRGNETISINIPSGKRGQYLDPSMSYLRFQLEVELKSDLTVPTWTRATEDNSNGNNSGIPIIALDGGAHALFTHLEVSHGSNVLEQIREYNALYQLLMDQGEDFDGYKGGRSLAEGTTPTEMYQRGNLSSARSGIVVTDVQLPDSSMGTYLTTDNTIAGPYYIRQEYTLDGAEKAFVNSTNLNTARLIGEQARSSLTAFKDATIVNDSGINYGFSKGQSAGVVSLPNFDKPRRRTFTFCMPIISGVLGSGMPKYVPVGILNSDLRLEIGLGPWEQAFKCVGRMYKNKLHVDPEACWVAGANRVSDFYNINITNVEFIADYIELAADVQLAVEQQHSGSYFMSYDSYQNFQQPLPAGSGNMSALIGAKVSSMKTIYTIFRDQHTINSLRGSQVTSRLNPFSSMPPRPEFKSANRDISDNHWSNGTGYYYSIGATHYPPTDVRSDPESYYEALKARHNLLMRHATGLITPKDWGISARVDSRYEPNTPNKDLALAPERWYHAAQQGGTFFLGMNFESQPHRSDFSNSGVSTLAQSMYLIARFPNVVDDFGEPVYIQNVKAIGTGEFQVSVPARTAPNPVAVFTGVSTVKPIGDANTRAVPLVDANFTFTNIESRVVAHDSLHGANAENINTRSFPGAIIPISMLSATAGTELDLVSGITNDINKKLYADKAAFKKLFTEYAYRSQQGAMVVDHWVHYDGFMVVEMGEVKTRW